jgi:4-hydroxy-tetrahydrodipicolinate synthase
MLELGEVITAMITPFNSDFEIDWRCLDNLLVFLVENGSDSLLLAGTTGESPTLTDEEKIELFKFAVKKFNKKVKIIAGTGSNDTKHTIYLSKNAQEVGVDALLLVAPYYNKPTQFGILKHFEEIANSVEIPIIVYNVPSRTGCNISSKTCVELSKIRNIAGIKEASSDMRQVAEILRDCPKEFLVYSGNDGDTFPIVAMGGTGVISVASHIIGKEIKEMIYYLKNLEINKAADIHKKFLDIFYGIFITTNPIPIKKALELKGLDSGFLRPPLCKMESREEDLFKQILMKYEII